MVLTFNKNLAGWSVVSCVRISEWHSLLKKFVSRGDNIELTQQGIKVILILQQDHQMKYINWIENIDLCRLVQNDETVKRNYGEYSCLFTKKTKESSALI